MLAAVLKNELQKDEPDPSGFAKIASRIAGLSLDEFKVIALIDASLSTLVQSSTDAPTQTARPFVSASQLASDPSNRENFNHFLLENVLNELAARALLVPESRTINIAGKHEQYYFASNSFMELIEKARNTLSAKSSP